jgi:hypothetical protein
LLADLHRLVRDQRAQLLARFFAESLRKLGRIDRVNPDRGPFTVSGFDDKSVAVRYVDDRARDIFNSLAAEK